MAAPSIPVPDQVKNFNNDTEDHIPDLLWKKKARDPRASTQTFICAHKDCDETCEAGSAPHCVLCPLKHPKKKNATFFYCEEHIADGINSLVDQLHGRDDGEGVCAKHFDAFEKLMEKTAKQFGGRTIFDMQDHEPEDSAVLDEVDHSEKERWCPELIKQIRIWRWRKYCARAL